MRKSAKSRTYMKLSILAIFLGSLLLPGCEDLLTGCALCGKLTPWSCGCNSTCYSDKTTCESESGQACHKCQ